jgi:hypothetical protein
VIYGRAARLERLDFASIPADRLRMYDNNG